jgi:NodT family efflux transporter outer membrane factor (OMF) lipoprotein
MTMRLFFAVSLCALATACTVGPNFHKPAPPPQTRYDREPLSPLAAPDGVAGGTQHWVQAAPDPQWWHQFASPQLDRLVERALTANTDLAATRAALRQAHEMWLSQRGILLPQVDAGASSSRNRSSQYLSPVLNNPSYYYGLQTAQVSVNYTIDLFGGNRRTVEQAHAQYDSLAFQTEAARISLINNVAAAAFQQASLAGQVDAQQRLIALQVEMLDILRHQQRLGDAAGADVIAQEAQLAQAQAALPPLQHALAQSRDLVAYLTGQTAADTSEPDLRLADITLPQSLPLSLPADLVRQRPDIRAAEAGLHAAGAGVGIAIANRLPQLTLSASAGGNSAGWSSLLSAANSFWSLGAGITQPIFDGGTLLHKQRAAKAAYDQADAQYRSTVLAAFQNVADTLAALRADADALAANQKARDKAQAALETIEHQQVMGDVSGMAVLQARQGVLLADQALVQAQAARLADTAALFQALGGGAGVAK